MSLPIDLSFDRRIGEFSATEVEVSAALVAPPRQVVVPAWARPFIRGELIRFLASASSAGGFITGRPFAVYLCPSASPT